MNRVKVGDAFTVNGALLRLTAIEGTTAVILDVRTGKKHTYGIDALQRIGKQCGFKIMVK